MSEEKKVSKVKIVDKIEDEAIEMLNSFKEHPIKSIFISIVILWGIKKLKDLLKGW